MGRWRFVDAARCRRDAVSRNKTDHSDIGADIVVRCQLYAGKGTVFVKRQRRVDDHVTRLIVANQPLAALAGPFDRPAHLLRRPGDQRDLRIEPAFHAVGAPDIAGDDGHFVFGNMEHMFAHHATPDVGALVAGVNGIVIAPFVVFSNDRARLHGVGGHPIDHKGPANDMGRAGQRCIHGVFIAMLGKDRLVIGAIVP